MTKLPANTRIIGLKRYRSGYRGILQNESGYLFFQFRRGRFRVLQHYAKADFPDYEHFVSFLSKFLPVGRVLASPLEIGSLNEAELARIFGQMKAGEVRLLGKQSRP